MQIGLGLSMRGPKGLTVVQQAINILRKYGTDAHVYLPGVGVLNGLTAGNYIDSAGTTAGVVDNPVGLVLDAAGGLGVELASATSITLTGAAGYTALTLGSVSIGKSYRVTYDYAVTSGTMQFGAGGSFSVGPAHTGPISGSYSYVATGVGTINTQVLYSNAAVGTVTNISVREVTGIAASQALTGAKPRLERGLRNLLLQSATLGTTPWISGGNGGTTFSGGKVLDTVTNGTHLRAQPVTCPLGAYTAAFILKAAEYTKVMLDFTDQATGDAVATFDLTTGAVSAVSSGGSWSATSATSLLLSDGSYLCTLSSTRGGGTATVPMIALNNGTTTSFAGTGTSGVFASAAALFQGTLTAAQIQANGGIPLTTTVAASNPDAGRYSWAFDGGDSLALGSVPFQMSDDHCVGAAFTPTALNGIAFSPGYSTLSDLRMCQIRVDGAGGARVEWYDGTTHANATAGSVIGIPTVMSGRRLSGVLSVSLNNSNLVGALGVMPGNIACNAAAIGTGSGGSPHTGNIAAAYAIKGSVTDSQRAVLDKFLALFQGRTI